MRLRFYLLGIVLAGLGVWGFLFADVEDRTTLAYGTAHLAAGLCAVIAARRGIGSMRTWGKILGAAFAAMAVAGFVLDHDAMAWLHIGVGVVFLYQALLAPPTL